MAICHSSFAQAKSGKSTTTKKTSSKTNSAQIAKIKKSFKTNTTVTLSDSPEAKKSNNKSVKNSRTKTKTKARTKDVSVTKSRSKSKLGTTSKVKTESIAAKSRPVKSSPKKDVEITIEDEKVDDLQPLGFEKK
jgi:hypothetical protein